MLIAPGGRPRVRPGVEADGMALSPELLNEFLNFLAEHGRSPETVKTYRTKLSQLYDWLPGDKQICRGTLEEWRKSLLDDGYAPRTVNLCISAANSFLEVHGRRELQIGKLLEADNIQPELTRNEYLRLLSTARALGKERAYLLVKVFGTMGLPLRALPQLTVEVAWEGRLIYGASILHIPACLRQELLDYATQEGIGAGPIFVTSSRISMNRSHVSKEIQFLSTDARVPEGKCNPRCLKKLYQSTRAGIADNISLLIEQTYDRLLDTEQLSIGWKQ